MSDPTPPALSVLVDLSVIRRAVIVQPAVIAKTISWGNQEHTVTLPGWERKPNLADPFLQQQVDCLPTIAHLTQEKRLELWSYIELGFEEMRGAPGLAGTRGDFFSDTPIQRASPAIDRSYFSGTSDFGKFVEKEALTTFCEFLLNIDPNTLQRARPFWNSLPDFTKRNLLNLDRFKALCRSLTRNHYADAFHLWTAEVNKFDYFLMIEKRFPNAVRGVRIRDFLCKPITPKELLETMGITRLISAPLLPSGPHGIFD